MSTPTKYHPKLSTLIDATAIPGDLKAVEQFTQGLIDKLLGDLRYTNYIVEHSPDGDTAFYSLIIKAKELRLPIFGTDMDLVFFEGHGSYSDFPIAMDWRWPIKRYINEFENQGFSHAPEAFLDILLSMADIESVDEVVEEIINVFLSGGTSPYENAIDEIKGNFQSILGNWSGGPDIEGALSNIIAQIIVTKNAIGTFLANDQNLTLIKLFQDYKTDSSYKTILDAVDSAKDSFETVEDTSDIDIDIYKIFIKAALGDITDINIQDKFDQLFELFQTWLGNITKQDIEDLLIPQFGFELSEVNMALVFPRKWVLPMMKDNNGSWIIDETVTNEPATGDKKKAAITFTAGALKYHTLTGFDIDILNSNAINLPRCLIPSIKIQLELIDIKLDLSREKNIAEAIADDRPDDFVGAFIASANIFLPEEWFTFDEDGSTLKLFAQDLLIGTGGVSGIIGIAGTSGIDTPLAASIDLKDGRTISIEEKSGDNATTDDAIVDIGDEVKVGTELLDKGRYILKDGGTIFVDENGKLERFAPSDGSLSYKFGKKGSANQWELGFNQFYLKLIQNKIITSEITGFITIPNFKRYIPEKQAFLEKDLTVNISALFENDGDFRMSASPQGGLSFGIEEVFYITVNSLSIGQDDAKTYIEVSGSLNFDQNDLLNKFIKDPIAFQKLRIYSDGSYEIQGGAIPIPASVTMSLGPVEVSITNITMGSEGEDNPLKFIGFSCAVSTGAGGIKGDSIKFMYNKDGTTRYLKISGISVDLIIPGNASQEDAALIIKGYLAMREKEYEGGVSMLLPQIDISGGAAMKMRPKVPAFVMDSFLSLPVPIPLATSGLGIFSFRGLFGLRYTPKLPEGALQDPKKFFDFYKEKVPNPLNGYNADNGLHLGKMYYPEDDEDPKKGTPVSIGAGMTLATISDAEMFSMEAFLFLSIPQFLLISGRANIMGERVTPMSTDVPFFAYLALTKEFISIGMGADYKLSKESDGNFLELEVEAQMAFFFQDTSAWYIHLGTKEKPNTARVIKELFDLNAYAYLMLSAQGIQAGAGVRFDFNKQYGPVGVEAHAYADTWVMMRFKHFQVGGGIAFGGSINARAFGVSLYFSLDTYLMATLPEPFLIKGGIRVCVSINLWIKKFEKCVNVDFKWELNRGQQLDEIGVLPAPANGLSYATDEIDFVSAFHLGSERNYAINSVTKSSGSSSNLPALDPNATTIPLDCTIDFQLQKAVDPTGVALDIGGFTNAAIMNTEFVPPRPVEKQVEHYFHLEEVNFKAWDKTNSVWVEYHPYDALGAAAFNAPDFNIDPLDLKIGYWQKQGKEYNKLRLMSNSPFSFIDNSPSAFIPERMGMTAATLFCKTPEKAMHCETWQPAHYFKQNKWTKYQSLLIKSYGSDASVVAYENSFGIPHSIQFDNHGELEILFPEAILACKLQLSSYAQQVKITFYALKDTIDPNSEEIIGQDYAIIEERTLQNLDWLIDIRYTHTEQSISKIGIAPVLYNIAQANDLKNQIYKLEQLVLEGLNTYEDGISYEEELETARIELKHMTSISCPDTTQEEEKEVLQEQLDTLEQLKKDCDDRIKYIAGEIARYCPILEEKERLLDICLMKNPCRIKKSTACLNHLTIEDNPANEPIIELIEAANESNDRYFKEYTENLKILEEKLISDYTIAKEDCVRWTNALDEKQKECADLTKKINALNDRLKGHRGKLKTDKCATYLHQVCWLTEEESYFNLSIPSQAAVEAEYDSLSKAHQVLAPILKPSQAYCIEIKTKENIKTRGNRNGVNKLNSYYVQFQTEGPIGHFSLKNLTESVKSQFELQPDGSRTTVSPDFDDNLDLPELSLRTYINYEISYPAADGNLFQKPLYYKNPVLNIFYTHPYVYHMFNQWPDYNGLGPSDCGIEIKIKDPTEDDTAPANPVLTQLPAAKVKWIKNTQAAIPKGLDAINKLREPTIKNVDFNGHTCWQTGGDPIIPFKKDMEVEVKDLLPSKLYNAVVYSKYFNPVENKLKSAIVHTYNFQTSRFANIEQQIESYKLVGKATDDDGLPIHKKEAIYTMNLTMGVIEGATVAPTIADAEKEIQKLILVAQGIEAHYPYDAKLLTMYPNDYERIISGYLDIKDMLPPVGTEFNYLVDETSNHFIGIWIRSVEPMNDPKTPDSALKKSITPYFDGQELKPIDKTLNDFENNPLSYWENQINMGFGLPWTKNNCVSLFSKDRCNVLILKVTRTSLPQDLKLKFDYLLWDNNSSEYVARDSHTTQNLIK